MVPSRYSIAPPPKMEQERRFAIGIRFCFSIFFLEVAIYIYIYKYVYVYMYTPSTIVNRYTKLEIVNRCPRVLKVIPTCDDDLPVAKLCKVRQMDDFSVGNGHP